MSCMEMHMSLSPHQRLFRRGQGLVEYALILLLVVLAAVAGLVLLAPTIVQARSAVSRVL